MSSSVRKGRASARYFVFILFVCAFLFVFLMARLMGGPETDRSLKPTIVPVFRVDQMVDPVKPVEIAPLEIEIV